MPPVYFIACMIALQGRIVLPIVVKYNNHFLFLLCDTGPANNSDLLLLAKLHSSHFTS